MKKLEIKWLIGSGISIILALALGLKWEKLLIVNPNGQRDIQYAQSNYEEEEDEEGDEEEEEDDEEYVQSENKKSSLANRPSMRTTFQRRQMSGQKMSGQNSNFGMNRQTFKPKKNKKTGGNSFVKVKSSTYQKIYSSEGVLHANYKFTNFKNNVIGIKYSMESGEYEAMLDKYGYRSEELDKLKEWHKNERNRAWKAAMPNGMAAANKAVKIADDDYEAKMRSLLYSRHLALKITTKTIEPDIPHIVKTNTPLMRSVAMTISSAAKEKNYSSEDIIGTVLSFVQTAMAYRQPPLVEDNGVHIAGVFPPFRAILTGWGDCDTKSALAASILGNWKSIKMVGISVPNHYLMAVRRIPGKGDIFIRYQGLEYVLLEPAGPAWLPPGTVSESTKTILARQDSYKIEPFFSNNK